MKTIKTIRGLVMVLGFILAVGNIENGNWGIVALGMTLIAMTNLGSIVYGLTNIKEICGIK